MLPGWHHVVQQLTTGSKAQPAGQMGHRRQEQSLGPPPAIVPTVWGINLTTPQATLAQNSLSELFRGQFPRSPTAKVLCFSLGFSKGLVRFFSSNFWNKTVWLPPRCPGQVTFLSPRLESSCFVPLLLNANCQGGFSHAPKVAGRAPMSPERFSGTFVRKRGTRYPLNL